MTHAIDTRPVTAALGTEFEYLRETDSVVIRAEDRSEIEVPAPDLREYLDHLTESDGRHGESDYTAAFRRSRDLVLDVHSRIEQERREGPELLAAILGVSPARREALLRRSAVYRTYEIASIALRGSRRAVLEDPRCARELAEVARSIAADLRPEIYGRERVLEQRAYAEAVYGNSLRVAGDLHGALKAFREARGLLQLTGGDSLEAIEIDHLETSLRRDLRDFPGALELSQRVVEGYRSCGMVREAVGALLKRAAIYENMGEPENAVSVLEEAESAMAHLDDPWLWLMVRHSLVTYLARGGRFSEAGEIFDEIQALYARFPKPSVTARRHWAEGLLRQGWGDAEGSERSFAEARTIFQYHGYAVEAALVSLDLGLAFAAQGRAAEVRELAAATFALLEVQGVHRDALAALAQFQQAAAKESLDAEVVRRIAQRLTRAAAFRPLPA